MSKPKIKRICKICHKEFLVWPYQIKRGHAKYCSKECSGKAYNRIYKIIDHPNKGAIRPRGEDTPNWKGDKVGYKCLHKWIIRWHGKAKKCEFCGKTSDTHKICWANISGKYKRDIKDYIQLCVSCHTKFDRINLDRIRDEKGRWI